MEKIYDEKWNLVMEYLPIIESMATIYCSDTFSYDDLYQEACIAVYENISDYDVTRGSSISSFLTARIKYRFFDLFARNKYEPFVPASYCVKAHKLYRLQQKEKISTGSFLTISEAALEMKVPEATVRVLENLNRRALRVQSVSLPSFYVNDVNEGDIDLEEFPETTPKKSMISDIDVEEEAILNVLVDYIKEEIDHLSEPKKQAILYHLGFVTGKEETFRDIAKIVGYSFQNVQKHYNSGIKILQKSLLEK